MSSNDNKLTNFIKEIEMKKLSLIPAIGTLLLLAGCTCNPVVVTKYVVVAPDDGMLVDCQEEAPPDKVAYMAGDEKEREKLLFDMALQQIKNVKLCNTRLKSVRDWKAKQIELYNKPSK
jgi:hypothetical protein